MRAKLYIYMPVTFIVTSEVRGHCTPKMCYYTLDVKVQRARDYIFQNWYVQHDWTLTRRCKVSILAFQSLKNYFWTLNCIDVQFCSLLWSSCCLGLENEGLLGSASPTKKIILLHKMVIIWILFLMTVWSGCFLCFMYSSYINIGLKIDVHK